MRRQCRACTRSVWLILPVRPVPFPADIANGGESQLAVDHAGGPGALVMVIRVGSSKPFLCVGAAWRKRATGTDPPFEGRMR